MSMDGQYVMLIEFNYSNSTSNTFYSWDFGTTWTALGYPFTMSGTVVCMSKDGKSGYIGTYNDHVVSFSNYGTSTALLTPSTTYYFKNMACNHDASILFADTYISQEYQWIASENNYNKVYFVNGMVIGDSLTTNAPLVISSMLLNTTGAGARFIGRTGTNETQGVIGGALNSGFTVGAFNINLSVECGGWIRSVGFIADSDNRIKCNVEVINDSVALNTLRLIEPKRYEYVDKQLRGNSVVFGFIAQEVRQQIPEAVTLTNDFIPDILSLCSYSNIGDNKIYIGNLSANVVVGDCIKLTDYHNNDIEGNIISINEGIQIQLNKEIQLSGNLLFDGNIFVYGKRVNDFHVLNKDYLFTINYSATQELDRKVSRLEAENIQLRNEITVIKNMLGII